MSSLNSSVSTTPMDTCSLFYLELGLFCVENQLIELAQECLMTVCTVNTSHDLKLTLMKDSLIHQLSIQALDEIEEVYSHDTMLKLLKVADLLTASKRMLDFNLIQYNCVILWNLLLPLLQQNSRNQLLKLLCTIANILKETSRYVILVTYVN